MLREVEASFPVAIVTHNFVKSEKSQLWHVDGSHMVDL
jgi:hypothetical protein